MELNKIYCEDCRETMKRMPDDFVDLVVTSPPYDDLRNYHGCKWDLQVFQEVARELYRIIKPGGIVVWVVNDKTENGSETLTSFLQAIYFRHFTGFNMHDTMIYASEKSPLSHNRYEPKFEYMFVLSKDTPKTFNPIMEKSIWAGDKRTSTMRQDSDILSNRSAKGFVKDKKIKGNIWQINTGKNQSTKDEIAFEHPAIFPEQLAADHIYSWSNEGDLVYDPFGGSGTTAKMAHLMQRNWIISEISEKYVEEVTKPRLEPYLKQVSIFDILNSAS